jgi:hypothetical protein
MFFIDIEIPEQAKDAARGFLKQPLMPATCYCPNEGFDFMFIKFKSAMFINKAFAFRFNISTFNVSITLTLFKFMAKLHENSENTPARGYQSKIFRYIWQ